MRKEVQEAMDKAHEARAMLRTGKISLEQAKELVAPYIQMVNEGGKRMSKEYGNSFRPVTATGFLR
jgi:hypothetical protein